MTRNCAACGFDVADYTQDDLLGTLRALVPMWRTMTMVIDDAVLATSPSPDALRESATQAVTTPTWATTSSRRR